MARLRRDYSHLDWNTLKALIAQGATLRELSKTYDVPYRTLASRSYRDRWNVKALQANLPPRTKEQQQHLEQVAREVHADIPALAREIRANFGQVLLRMSRFYQQQPPESVKKDSRAVLQFIYAASKLLGWNDSRSPLESPQLNVQLLALKPGDLAAITQTQTQRELGTVQAAARITDSSSVDASTQGVPNQGTPNTSDAPIAKSAARIEPS